MRIEVGSADNVFDGSPSIPNRPSECDGRSACRGAVDKKDVFSFDFCVMKSVLYVRGTLVHEPGWAVTQ